MKWELALKQRFITSFILIPIIIVALFFASLFWFSTVIAIIILFAAWEWSGLCQIRLLFWRIIFSVTVVLFCLLLFYLLQRQPFMRILYFSFLFWIFAFSQLVFYNFWQWSLLKIKWISYLCCIATLFSFWFGLIILWRMNYGAAWILFLLFFIWMADASAYFSGHLWGKKKLIPKISPGKTWAGLWGEITVALLFSLVVAAIIQFNYFYVLKFLLLALVTVIISVWGDLFISVLKRQSKVKDTGNLLPGHGGILDRIDSLLAAVPIFTLGLFYLGLHYV